MGAGAPRNSVHAGLAAPLALRRWCAVRFCIRPRVARTCRLALLGGLRRPRQRQVGYILYFQISGCCDHAPYFFGGCMLTLVLLQLFFIAVPSVPFLVLLSVPTS